MMLPLCDPIERIKLIMQIYPKLNLLATKITAQISIECHLELCKSDIPTIGSLCHLSISNLFNFKYLSATFAFSCKFSSESIRCRNACRIKTHTHTHARSQLLSMHFRTAGIFTAHGSCCEWNALFCKVPDPGSWRDYRNAWYRFCCCCCYVQVSFLHHNRNEEKSFSKQTFAYGMENFAALIFFFFKGAGNTTMA